MTMLDTMLDECGLADELTGPEVALLGTVTGPLEHLLGDAPVPSAALEAALAQRFAPYDARPPALVRRVALGSAAAIVAVVASTGIAAANNKLPAPLQREIAEFSHDHLPFEFPAPTQKAPVRTPRPVQPSPPTVDDRSDDHGGVVDRRDDRVEPGDDRDDQDAVEDRDERDGGDADRSGSDSGPGGGSDDELEDTSSGEVEDGSDSGSGSDDGIEDSESDSSESDSSGSGSGSDD